MSIKLGSIVVDLTANTVSFSNEMTKASQLALNSGKNIQRSLSLVSGAATAMAAGIVASLTAVIDKTEVVAFTMQRMAATTGTSNEMFSKLAYSAKLSGTPLESLSMSMERLSKTAGAARSGSKEQAAAFAAIGISVKDLNGPLNDAGNLTVAVAKKMDGYAESTNKTALEQKFFGRSGAELAPMLKQIATGFDTASQQATLFGVVIGDKAAAQAKKLHESMVQLESISLGFGLRLLSGVAPALESVADKIVKVATSADGMHKVETIAKDVSGAVTLAGNAFEFLAQHTTAAKRALEALAALQVGSILLPLVSSAAKAGTGLDTIGLTAVKMIGRLSGVSAVLPLLKSVSAEIQLQSFMMIGLARSEGIASAATYGLSTAWKALTASMLANPGVIALGLLTASLYVVYKAMQDDVAASAKFGDAAVSWHDYWAAAIDNTKDSLRDLKTILTSFSISDVQKAVSDYHKIPTFGNRVHQEANLHKYLNAPDLNPTAELPAPKREAPAVPAMGKSAEKVDQLKLKMAELAASAQAAQKALADAGKGVDFERANEITKEYDKTVLELEAHLKAQHKTLSETDKAAIRSSIATRINDESQARFRNEVVQSTQQILAQASAQGILTAAIGQSAAAMRQAQVDAEFKTKYAGQSPEWIAANQDLINKQKAARNAELSAADGQKNTSALDSLKGQVSVQEMLNSAIISGRKAMEDSRLASEQAAIRKSHSDRGDSNQGALDAELAKNEELFRLKQSETNLSRAASMDAARTYHDEAEAIRDAADAARAAGQPLSAMAIGQAQKAALDRYRESVDETTLSVGSLSDGFSVFFQQMSRETESAAQQIHAVLGNAFESLNGTLARLLTGQKASFAEFFRGISSQLAKIAVQKGEQAIAGAVLGKLGVGKTSDPTVSAIQTSNGYLRQILGVLSSSSMTGGSESGIGAAVSAAGAGSGLSSVASALAPFASLIPGMSFMGGFGGHRALSGNVTAGMTYDVGEMGRERFTPTQDGKITPNKSMGGNVINMPIDARYSNDPAQTEAAIHRAMGQYAPHIAAGANRAAMEQKARAPLSKH